MKNKILLISVAIMLAVVLVVAGCPSPEPTLTPTTTPEPTAEPELEPVVIGIAMSLSGWMNEWDQPSLNSALLKIEEINAAGGLLGHPLNTVFADTKSDPEQAVRAFTSVLDKGAQFIIMSCSYDFSAAGALVADRAGIITIAPGASHPLIGVAGPYIFSVIWADQAEGFNMAGYSFNKLGARTAYVLVDQEMSYSKNVASGFKSYWEQLGGEILGEDTLFNSDPSFSSQVTRIKNLAREPDVIALCSWPPGGATLIRQLRAAGVQTTIMGDAVFDGDYWLDAVPGLSNFYYPTHASLFGGESDPAKAETLKKYVAEYGKPTMSDFLLGYSIVEGWALAVERAGTFESEAVRKELEKFRDEELTCGATTFTPELHITPLREMMMMNVEDGKHSALGYFRSEGTPSMEILFPK